MEFITEIWGYRFPYTTKQFLSDDPLNLLTMAKRI
jgi:hypothetical protein